MSTLRNIKKSEATEESSRSSLKGNHSIQQFNPLKNEYIKASLVKGADARRKMKEKREIEFLKYKISDLLS